MKNSFILSNEIYYKDTKETENKEVILEYLFSKNEKDYKVIVYKTLNKDKDFYFYTLHNTYEDFIFISKDLKLVRKVYNVYTHLLLVEFSSKKNIIDFDFKKSKKCPTKIKNISNKYFISYTVKDNNKLHLTLKGQLYKVINKGLNQLQSKGDSNKYILECNSITNYKEFLEVFI